MSALGQKADICNALAYVRFTPESGHVRCNFGKNGGTSHP
jgi:hypothetical protein